jgi:DUF1009 family protein
MLSSADDPTAAPPLGILAGGGSVPGEVVRALRTAGRRVHVVAIDGSEATPGLAHATYGWGSVGAILASFRTAGCRELMFVGSVRRPDLTRLRPDLGLLWHLPGLLRLVLAGGDDGLARSGIRFVEGCGFGVVGIADVAPDILVPHGALGGRAPTAAQMADILLGSAVVRALGRHDIGQAVVVAGGRIVAIEGAEGTDRMLERVARRRTADGHGGAVGGGAGVVVKRPKPGQELRIDIPAIGPRTVERAHAAGLAGIAVLAGLTLAADRPEMVRRADAAGLFVYAFTEGDTTPDTATPRGDGAAALAPLGRRRPSDTDRADAARGLAAVTSLAALGSAVSGSAVSGAGSAVVVNGYVIGIEPSADAVELVARTRDIRPWGIARWRRRAGALAIAGHPARAEAWPEIVAAAAAARLAAIAVGADVGHGPTTLVAAADAHGIAVLRGPAA